MISVERFPADLAEYTQNSQNVEYTNHYQSMFLCTLRSANSACILRDLREIILREITPRKTTLPEIKPHPIQSHNSLALIHFIFENKIQRNRSDRNRAFQQHFHLSEHHTLSRHLLYI